MTIDDTGAAGTDDRKGPSMITEVITSEQLLAAERAFSGAWERATDPTARDVLRTLFGHYLAIAKTAQDLCVLVAQLKAQSVG